ncbi:MAG: tRNA 2-selenouridine(34) synthase MnmH [Parvularculaceae bacterium]
MIEPFADASPQTLSLFDAVIDVRSPAEFSEDRLPGAINLPVLSNEERAEVGEIYVQQSRFLARRIGAAHVARNVARHLDEALSDRDAKYRPLLYCWRGGMRSGSMATILSQIGWRVGVLQGGYKTWRHEVVEGVSGNGEPFPLILLDGETCTAKTAILNELKKLGVQTIDLEGLAAHKGSVFGADPESAQPKQKHFESLLWDELRKSDQTRPIIVEAESSRIGDIVIPKRMWSSMRAAPRIFVSAPVEARARYACENYSDFIRQPGAIDAALSRLKPFHSKERIARWRSLAEEGALQTLAAELMVDHYDPRYQKARQRGGENSINIAMSGLGAGELQTAAQKIAETLATNTVTS